MPVPANNVPIHHWPLLGAGLSCRCGGMGCRRVVHVGKSDRQKDTKNDSK